MPHLAIMGFSPPIALLGMGEGEMVLVMGAILIFFGGKGMPELAKGMGKMLREFKKATTEVEREFKRVMDETERQTITPFKSAAAPILKIDPLAQPAGPAATAPPTPIPPSPSASLPPSAAAPAAPPPPAPSPEDPPPWRPPANSEADFHSDL